MKQITLRNLLILSDFISGAFAWFIFYFLRKYVLEEGYFKVSDSLLIGLVLVPFFWLIVYLFQGTYHSCSKMYRLKIIQFTVLGTFIGALILFFVLLLDDHVSHHSNYYFTFILLISVHLVCTIIPRYFIVWKHVHSIHKRDFGFKTIIIGGGEKAKKIFNEIDKAPRGIGANFIGFINANGNDTILKNQLLHLGHVDQLSNLREHFQFEEVIIAIESQDQSVIKDIINILYPYDIKIKMIPNEYQEAIGEVGMTNIFGALLVELQKDPMPVWQIVSKRIFDVLVSLSCLIILIPLYIILSICVKTSSKGPIFFMQERIGLGHKPFKIIKFRTMFMDAERAGPQLSSDHDPRVTIAGRWMRKLRLDEFPQFYNVLIGDMSLVGPRPERSFFINQITQVAPQFLHLTSVRPGITSWGQVKFGYAENVDEMLQRMKYDLLYLRNRTLALDFKIMLHTVLIVFRAEGK
jgi:exopolysaccharide biosynthesis polyprenyl glycosylphosphotransferase